MANQSPNSTSFTDGMVAATLGEKVREKKDETRDVLYLCFPHSTLVARLGRSYARMFGCFVKDACGRVEGTTECTAGERRFDRKGR